MDRRLLESVAGAALEGLTGPPRAVAASVTLRGYRPGDVDRMYALDVLCFEPRFRFSRRTMRRFAEADGAIVVIAEVAGEMAGFSVVQMEGLAGYVVTLDVAPAWRRAGIARSVIAAMEARVREFGGDRIGLHVFAGNESAVRFYEACGYEGAGIAKNFYGRGLDGLMYAKRWSDAPVV